MENTNSSSVQEFYDSLFQSEEEKEQAKESSFESEVDIDGAIEKYKEYKDEEDRLKNIYDGRATELKDKFDTAIEKIEKQKKWLEFNLKNYVMASSDKKELKTMFKKKYLSGEVQVKKPIQKLNKPDLSEEELKTNFSDYTKIKTELDWSKLKASLKVVGQEVYNEETGEILTKKIPVETVPEKVVIK